MCMSWVYIYFWRAYISLLVTLSAWLVFLSLSLAYFSLTCFFIYKYFQGLRQYSAALRSRCIQEGSCCIPFIARCISGRGNMGTHIFREFFLFWTSFWGHFCRVLHILWVPKQVWTIFYFSYHWQPSKDLRCWNSPNGSNFICGVCGNFEWKCT